MKKKIFILMSLLLLFIIALTGCKKDNKVDSTDADSKTAVTAAPTITKEPTPTPVPEVSPTASVTQFTGALANLIAKGDYPVVDGSTATIPLSEAVYRLATGATADEAASDIVHTKTSNAYYRLMNREADLLIVYAPSEQVLTDIKSGGHKLNIKPIGKDALIFMANSSNSVESLTSEQLVDIYSGSITNWKEVGGEDKPIVAFQRPEESGSQTLMKKLVMKDTPMMTGPNVVSYETMSGILEAMADYTNEGNTLGYSVFYYAQNMYNLPELKFMKVDNVEPSLQTIYDNTYPYINEFYAVIREDEATNSNARKIFDWLTGEEGQTLVRDLGYVPVSMGITENSIDSTTLKQDKLPDGYLYVGGSYSSNGVMYSGYVTVYDQNWKEKKVFQNAYVFDNTGLLPEDSLIPIGVSTFQDAGTYSMSYGLYSLKEDKFLLPTKYDYIGILDKDKGYYIVNQEGGNKVIDRQQKVLCENFQLGEGFGVTKLGDYYWLTDYDPEKNIEVCTVYNSEFKIVSQFDKNYEDYELYNYDGSVYFSKEMFYKKFKYTMNPADTFYLQSYNADEPLISVYYNGTFLILDRKLNVVAQKQESQEYSTYYNLYYNIFSDNRYDTNTSRDIGVFYDANGKAITDKSGNTYSSMVNDSYWRSGDKHEQVLYYEADGKLHLLNNNTKEEIHIDIADWDNLAVSYVYRDLVVVGRNDDTSKTRVYKGNQMICELEGSYYADYNNNSGDLLGGILLVKYGDTFDSNDYVMVNSEGKVVYESVYKENIFKIDNKYIQLHRGNYWGVIDYEGNYIVKAIKSALNND